ncbi:thioredoxin-related protein [Granulicella arctica]|uniref:Thioredoxin-related protein n=2 Tax=Granulicella arctica TaxID=940613 RepID=A0A7Y9PGW6_9BACT|nr:thioredoxin-related protein [Granulicella arctica]
MKKLEIAANVAVLFAVVVFLFVVGRGEFRKYEETRPAKALVGQTIGLPGFRFASSGKTLVLAISTTCHFCKDSEPFYRDLTEKSNGRVDFVAVLPQALDVAQSYVQQSIAPSVHVVSARLDSIGVRGTPTLLLVDGNGKVQDVWVGKLDDKGQRQVRSLLTQ